MNFSIHTARSTSFRRIVLSLAVVGMMFAMLATPAVAQSNVKIGYVDLQRALNEVEDGKRVKAQLKSEFDTKQKQLDQKQEELRKLKEQLESQAMLLSEPARQQAAADFQQKMYELQQLYVSLQGELSQREAEATKKIFDKMGKILEQIGKEHNYTIILERTESSVLFAREGLDVTDELIKRYNKK